MLFVMFILGGIIIAIASSLIYILSVIEGKGKVKVSIKIASACMFTLGVLISWNSFQSYGKQMQKYEIHKELELKSKVEDALDLESESIEIIKEKDYKTFIVKVDETFYEFYIDKDLITHRVIDVKEVSRE